MKTTKSKSKTMPRGQSSSSIQDFFKSVPKESVGCTPTDIKSVYVNALRDRLKNFGEQSDSNDANDLRNDNYDNATSSSLGQTTETNNKLTTCKGSEEMSASSVSERVADKHKTNGCGQCDEWRRKYEEVSKSYLKLSLRHSELLMKHDDLVQTSTGAKSLHVDAESDVVSLTSKASHDVFSENEIRCLQSLPLEKKKDSTFILHCVQYAYKNDPDSLCTKTLKGTRGRFEIHEGSVVAVKSAKNPMTPEKVDRIQQLFIDRVTKSKCLAGEFGERVKQVNINKLIANAIKTVSIKSSSKAVATAQNADLEL